MPSSGYITYTGWAEDPPEGDQDGGPRWFRVVFEPHVPARAKPHRNAPHYDILSFGEVFEAAEVSSRWARLSIREMWRRKLPDNEVAWVKIHADNIGRLLLPVAAPPDECQQAGCAIMWVDSVVPPVETFNGEVSELAADADMIAQVVEEHEMAWEMLQARRQFLQEDEKAFSIHKGFLSVGGDILVEKMTIQEAKAKCSILRPRCQGFTWKGGADESGPVEIRFKSTWNFHSNAKWTSCKVEQDW